MKDLKKLQKTLATEFVCLLLFFLMSVCLGCIFGSMICRFVVFGIISTVVLFLCFLAFWWLFVQTDKN
jgi:hypothetical protein